MAVHVTQNRIITLGRIQIIMSNSWELLVKLYRYISLFSPIFRLIFIFSHKQTLLFLTAFSPKFLQLFQTLVVLKRYLDLKKNITSNSTSPQKKDTWPWNLFITCLKDYNADHVFSLLCFGARSIPISHELRVKGIDAVLQAYRTCLETVTLGESRNFVPPIEHVVRNAKTKADSYSLLIILTDGDTTADVRQITQVNLVEQNEIRNVL